MHFFPLATAILFPVTFLATYSLSVFLGHTEMDWPYISDTSAYPPESCIFSQMINLGACLVAITVYIRYKQVKEFYLSHQMGVTSHRLNQLGLMLGWIGALGISIVANFQETSVFIVHFIGAMMAFGVGTLYMWTQVYASFILCSLCHGRALLYWRGFLAAISSVGFPLMLTCGVIASEEFRNKDKTKWHPEDGGWGWHVASTSTEWVIATCFFLFLLSFVSEFRKISLDSPQICVRITNRDALLFDERDQTLFRSTYADSVTSTEDIPASVVRT